MLRWLAPPAAERLLLPGGRMRGPTPYVIGIMAFAMVIVAAAGLALANAASVVAGGIESRFTLQLPSSDTPPPRAAQRLKAVPGVAHVEPVPRAETHKTLERWLGAEAASLDLPVPQLIHFDAAGDAQAVGVRVERAFPGATVTAHGETLEPLLQSMRALQWLALILVLLMAAAASAAVVLAARGALDTHRSTIEVMHGIGATDVQIARLFQRKIALDALTGSLAGTAAATLVLVLLAGGRAAFGSELTGAPPLGALDLALLAILPFLLALLATWVARMAVLTALRRAT